MIGIYFIGAILIGLALFINRNKTLNYLLVTTFAILQWVLTIYEYNRQDITQLVYFTPDAFAIIFLITLSIICVPAFLHSYIFFAKNKDVSRERSIYYASM